MNYNLVLHVDVDDPARVGFVFGNMRNYLKDIPAGDKASLVVVANGPAVRCFTKRHADLEAAGRELMRQGVSLRMCQNALKAFGVDEASLWEGVQTVSGGITELCRLQQEGYSYIKP
ncbi:MAG: DsrE family protein [Desulfovibrio sp.]|nr:DsrE family protein [Desulfovibrio sp.]MBR6468125.1 DsrE family protein [Desulfovibrio sp.]MCR5260168.1 DsrE family protein [Desulfovibrio sp.]